METMVTRKKMERKLAEKLVEKMCQMTAKSRKAENFILMVGFELAAVEDSKHSNHYAKDGFSGFCNTFQSLSSLEGPLFRLF
jgi:hypothetical protein